MSTITVLADALAPRLGENERNTSLIGERNGSGTARQLRILQVSPADISGGAEKVAWDLFQTYLARGYSSWLAVGRKLSDHPGVFVIPDRGVLMAWRRFWFRVSGYLSSMDGRFCGARHLADFATGLAEPVRWTGIENFHFPGSKRVLELSPSIPNLIHLHNLHGHYFDLRVLPRLTQQIPVLLTLHDAWLLSGHCAHSFDCQRWKTGCGECPNLDVYPAIPRDATAYNWRRKREIFARSVFYVATPSRWLMQKVEQSMLAPAIKRARVIPCGIDLTLFRPVSKQEARAALGLPRDSTILLFSANRIRENVFKDYRTIRASIAMITERLERRDILLVALGEDAPAEQIGRAELRFVPYQKEPSVVASYYQAADVYLHAAKADTFPMTILEALACGTPVVATAVGGIPEQVKGLQLDGLEVLGNVNRHPTDETTGVLVPPADPKAIAFAVKQLLSNSSLRLRMGDNAARDAKERFDLQKEADCYLDWYRDVLQTNSNFQPTESMPRFPS